MVYGARLCPRKGREKKKNGSETGDCPLSQNPGDICSILRMCRVLSLNDSYWVVEDGFDGRYVDYSLYEHDFEKALHLS